MHCVNNFIATYILSGQEVIRAQNSGPPLHKILNPPLKCLGNNTASLVSLYYALQNDMQSNWC